jgi:hypothetical protein
MMGPSLGPPMVGRSLGQWAHDGPKLGPQKGHNGPKLGPEGPCWAQACTLTTRILIPGPGRIVDDTARILAARMRRFMLKTCNSIAEVRDE